MANPDYDNSSALAAWVHQTVDVPARGLTRERAATDSERADLARMLGVQNVDRLVAKYEISAITGGGWRLKGIVSAGVIQSCVVTLEPVATTIEDEFDVEFWSVREAEGGEDDRSVLSGPDIETLERDEIDVGRIVFELLSAGLDPYPRKADANFDWQDPAASDPAKSSPFAVLSKLRDKT